MPAVDSWKKGNQIYPVTGALRFSLSLFCRIVPYASVLVIDDVPVTAARCLHTSSFMCFLTVQNLEVYTSLLRASFVNHVKKSGKGLTVPGYNQSSLQALGNYTELIIASP